MHELGLCEGILAVVSDIAGDRAVRRVTVRVGALQRIDRDSLEFSFGLLAAGTPADSASLEVVSVPARLRCPSCGAEGDHDPVAQIVCWDCGASSLGVIRGEEVLVDEVELDGEPPEVIRRPGTEVIEPPHEHPHEQAPEPAQSGQRARP